jgi:hypothetical protein
MTRIVNGSLRASANSTLTPAQIREAQRRLEKSARENPLRRVRLACHGPVRDPSARLGDRVWCDSCADFAVVVSVAE